jgi:hypothetical protein
LRYDAFASTDFASHNSDRERLSLPASTKFGAIKAKQKNEMTMIKSIFIATLAFSYHLATAETAAQFQDEVATQITQNVCKNEMSNVGFFASSRAKGKSRDEMLVMIDNFVTSQNASPTMARLHQLMLNIAYTGPVIKSTDDSQINILEAKAHLACIHFMDAVANGAE